MADIVGRGQVPWVVLLPCVDKPTPPPLQAPRLLASFKGPDTNAKIAVCTSGAGARPTVPTGRRGVLRGGFWSSVEEVHRFSQTRRKQPQRARSLLRAASGGYKIPCV